jgi:hypothetical protein
MILCRTANRETLQGSRGTFTEFAAIALALLATSVRAQVQPLAAILPPTSIILSTGTLASQQSFVLQFTNAVVCDVESDSVFVLSNNAGVSGLATNTPEAVPPAAMTNIVALAGGFGVEMALTNSGLYNKGHIIAWGYNEFGQNDVPNDATNVIAMAVGWWHALALRGDHTVLSWGEMTNVPAGLSNVTAIAAGQQRSLALKFDGTIVEWGSNAYPVPSNVTNAIAISTDSTGDLAVLADGKVAEWNPESSSFLPGITNAVAVSGDENTYLVLLADGSVVSGGASPLSFSQPLSNVCYVNVGQGVHEGAVITSSNLVQTVLLPQSQVVPTGGTIYLHGRAVGMGPITYQWSLNFTDIPGATNADLIITNAAVTDGGVYEVQFGVQVGNVGEFTKGPGATITVLVPQIQALLNASLVQSNDSLLLTASAPNGAPFPLSSTNPFILEASSDLINWQPYVDGVSLSNGVIQLFGFKSPTNAGKFYRLAP